VHELVKKTHLPKNFMTKSCDLFHQEKYCAYGKRCQFMHSERDIYATQDYSTVLRENSRLATAKITTVNEVDANSQIYINVFERRGRLSCFAEICEEGSISDEKCESGMQNQICYISEYLSKDSDESTDKLFEDFGVVMTEQKKKKRPGKATKKRKIIQSDFKAPFL